MNKVRRFEDTLNECLENIHGKRSTLEECLARYPEHAEDLEPLLRVALAVEKASSVEPRPEFKAQARSRLQAALYARAHKHPRGGRAWWWQWAAAAAVLLVLFAAGGGTLVASADSMPDQSLYPVKIAGEQIQMFFTRSDVDKAKLNARLAEVRLQEIDRMARAGKLEHVEKVLPRLKQHLEMAGYAQRIPPGKVPELRNILETNAMRDVAALKALKEQVPERAKPALERVLQVSKEKYEKALRATGGNVEKVKSEWEKPERGNGNR